METLLYPTINFSLLLFMLFFFLRKPAKSFIQLRHETIRNNVFEVRERLRVAHAQFEEFEAKLKAIDGEVQSLKSQARRDAEKFRERVIQSAEKTATGIVEDAKVSAQNNIKELKTQLRSEMGLKIIERAEKVLKQRLATVDKTQMVREFSSLVERV